MRKLIFSIIGFFILLNTLGQKKNRIKSDYLFSLQVKIGNLREGINVTDSAFRLSRSPKNHIIGGAQFIYHHTARSRFLLDYQYESLGHSPLFANPIGIGATSTITNFHRIALLFENDILPLESNSRLALFFRAGPSISLTQSSDAYGSGGFFSLNAANDTIESLFDTSKTNRSAFLSLGGSIGLRYRLSSRWFITGSVSRFWNVTSNDITTTRVGYKAHDLSGYHSANIRTNGNILSYQLSLGYNFHRNESKEKRRERLIKENAEADSLRRLALIFNTSNNYTKNYLNDPAGYLTSKPYLRFTFGLQLRYRISEKWFISGGFESFPNGVDPRPEKIVAGNGVGITNAYQFPISAEYKLVSFRKKVKFDVFVKSGLVFGILPFTKPAESIANPDSSYFILENPIYYEEIEASTLRKKNFWAISASLNLNLYLSNSIFLLGYVNQQTALNKTPFIQRDVEYKMNASQPEFYRATSFSTGTVFQIGFGIGYRF
jgi:hypothetical protein